MRITTLGLFSITIKKEAKVGIIIGLQYSIGVEYTYLVIG